MNIDTYLKVYDGGSGRDVKIWQVLNGGETFNHMSNEWVPSSNITSKGNQLFIIFKTNCNGVGKGFTAKITFGIRTNYGIIINFVSLLFATNHLFKHVIDNICENALDGNGKLIVENHWSVGTNCQWLISAEDDKHYINLEFEHLDVRTYELDYYPCIRGP